MRLFSALSVAPLIAMLLLPGAACGADYIQMKLPVRLDYIDSSNGLETPAMEGGRTEIELGDVNADGFVDIVCIGDHGSPYIGTDQHGVMVWFGNGGDRWEVYQNGNFGYGGVSLGDVDGDGFMDVGYGMHHNYSGDDFGDQLIEVALGDGTGKTGFRGMTDLHRMERAGVCSARILPMSIAMAIWISLPTLSGPVRESTSISTLGMEHGCNLSVSQAATPPMMSYSVR